MFGKKYKKGMADAAKAYEAFGKKQEDALNHILEEVRSGKKDITEAVQQLNGNIDNLYEHLKSREKAQLYTVYTPFDIKELGEQERLFLVGALYRLTTDRTPNENQQNYLRAIQKYLDIKEPPFGTDPMAIENIEDIPSQKAIFQAVLEFLCLQDGDSYDETELQQSFLDSFSINSKNRQVILEHVELLYTATGAKGLAEKYGYVPEEEQSVEAIIDEEIYGQKQDDKDIEGDIADIIYHELEYEHEYMETLDYLIYEDYSFGICAIEKKTGEVKGLIPEDNYPYQCVRDLKKWLSYQNTVFAFFSDNNYGPAKVFIIDVRSSVVTPVNLEVELHHLATNGRWFAYTDYNGKVVCFDLEGKKKYSLKREASGEICCTNEALYFADCKYSEKCLVEFSFKSRSETVIASLPDVYSCDAISYIDNKIFAMLKTDIESDYRGYCVGYIDIASEKPGQYRVIKSEIQVKSIFYHHDSGLVYVEFKKNYPIKNFNYKTLELETLGENCGYSSRYKGCTLYSSNRIMKLGNWLYYRQGEDGPEVRVSINRPMEIELLGESL